jgi:hypothetical protein
MQSYTIFFIIVSALHVSVGLSAHHKELKNCTHSMQLASKPGIYQIVCAQFWAPDDGRRNRPKHAEN